MMRVTIPTFVVDDEFRRLLRRSAGRTGLATRAEVRQWYVDSAEQHIQDLHDDAEAESEHEQWKRESR